MQFMSRFLFMSPNMFEFVNNLNNVGGEARGSGNLMPEDPQQNLGALEVFRSVKGLDYW